MLTDGAAAVHGARQREAVSWDYPGLFKMLNTVAKERTGLPVLRCYWYEATVEGRRTSEHDALADIPGLKFRMSRIRPGRREGVEAQLHRDLMTLARNSAVCDAVLISGDEDLAQVVSEAQDLGMRVTIMHISAEGGWVASRSLRQECDDLVEIGGVHLRPYATLAAGAGETPALTNGQTARPLHQQQHPQHQQQQHHQHHQQHQPHQGGANGQAGVPFGGAHAGPAQGTPSPRLGAGPSHPQPVLPAYTGYSPAKPADPQGAPSPSQQGSSLPPLSGPQPVAPSGPSSPPQAASPYGQAGTAGPPGYQPGQLGAYTGPHAAPVPPQAAAPGGTSTLAESVKAAHKEGHDFGDSVAKDAPALWLEAVLARKPRMPSDLEARLLQGSSLPIDFLLHDEVRHALRRGFWDALERARR
ncbi:hypothetical protein GCM10017673_26300 [Streptosporangium violaceochromogenes]|nr:hypothetical protein GCM10017673_26300 [Streptosporangium violaceochromogenes]